MICLRRGALGAVAYDARTGEGYACEAFPVSRVVDETGCGNCFCGRSAALRRWFAALTLASAAASIMVEHIGVPNGSIDEYRALAATRARAVDATVTLFSVAWPNPPSWTLFLTETPACNNGSYLKYLQIQTRHDVVGLARRS